MSVLTRVVTCAALSAGVIAFGAAFVASYLLKYKVE